MAVKYNNRPSKLAREMARAFRLEMEELAELGERTPHRRCPHGMQCGPFEEPMRSVRANLEEIQKTLVSARTDVSLGTRPIRLDVCSKLLRLVADALTGLNHEDAKDAYITSHTQEIL